MDDQTIIDLLFQRDQSGIHALSSQYGAYCAHIARNVLENEQDVEECLNDAYLSVWNTIPPQKPENLSAFIGRITRNLALNRYRNAHAQKRGGNVSFVLCELSQVVSGNPTPEQELQHQELTASINAYLASLPQWKRYIFVRRYWYADSVSQIAKYCGKTESYVSMTLTRLRRQLQKHLTERGFDL